VTTNILHPQIQVTIGLPVKSSISTSFCAGCVTTPCTVCRSGA
jgi:hypothetical protein